MCSSEARNYFPKTGFFLKIKSNFLIFMGVITNFDKFMHEKSANFVRIWVL